MTISEILKNNNIMTETAAAEFYKLDNKYFAILNGKTTSLEDFISLASKDDSYADVVSAIKAKMNAMKFNGSVIDFIKRYFKTKNERLDVFVKNGNNNNIYDKSSIIRRASYDEKEISTELEKEKNLYKENTNYNNILIERYNEEANRIADEIIDRFNNSSKKQKIYIGDLFGIEKNKAYMNVSSSNNMNAAAETTIERDDTVKYKYIINIKPYRSKQNFKSFLLHEIIHILNYKKSKGKTYNYIANYDNPRNKYYERNQIPSKIKKFKNRSDKNWSRYNLDYIKNADELDAFYNQFLVFLKGKKYKNSLEIRKDLYERSSILSKDHIDYYLKDNKAIKKYFMKRFYQDGIIKSVEDNV